MWWKNPPGMRGMWKQVIHAPYCNCGDPPPPFKEVESTSDDVYDAIVNFTDASVVGADKAAFVKIAEMTSEEDQKTALLCHLLGHKWKTGPGDHTASDSRKWFRKYCERCGEVVVK
jgi:hypothetical protein